MKKVLFIDHSFHQKTKSSDFFKKILEKRYKVEILWDDGWRGGKEVSLEEINSINPSIVIYWQIMPKLNVLKKIKSKNIILIPMEEYERSVMEWLIYKTTPIKILCFQKKNFDIVSRLGFESLYLQYFPEPRIYEKDYSKLKILFWQRTKDITWGSLKKIIGNQKIDSIFFKNIPDPFMFNLPIPSKEEIKKYNITISSKWLSDLELQELYKNFTIFIAPRKYEGIGMAFLEAMSYGMVVIAPDTPTHNEYIKNGFNGFLYDINNPQEINFDNLKFVGRNALLTVIEGYRKWKEGEDLIFDFIEKEIESYKITSKYLFFEIYLYTLFYNFKNSLKKLLKNFIYKIFYKK